jgi:uncharacterized protein
MKEELLQLVTLQKYDRQILEIEDHLSGLNKEIETASVRLEKANLQVAAKKQEVEQLRVQSQRIDGEIADAENQYKTNSYQLMTLKDQRSYESMKLQMEELRNKIADRETKGIELLGKLEETEKTLAMYNEKISQESLRIQGLRDQKEEQRQTRSAESEGLKTKRNGYAKLISPMMLSKYEHLLKLPDRQAIAEVIPSSRTCKGCYSSITRENMESVKSMDKVVTCNRCGRILYIPSLLGHNED